MKIHLRAYRETYGNLEAKGVLAKSVDRVKCRPFAVLYVHYIKQLVPQHSSRIWRTGCVINDY